MQVRNVLVVVRDVVLRESLRELLHEDGYASVGVSDLDLAWSALRLSPYPLVVLVSHGDAQFSTDALIKAVSMLPCHAYALLSTSPNRAPHLRNPHTQRLVPVVSLPEDLDQLTAIVDTAARCLGYWQAGSLAEQPLQARAEALAVGI